MSDPRVTVVVQARMGSSRLPGKVLMELDGRPMLRYLLDRLALPGDLDLVVATSSLARDDAVAECAAVAGVAVVRGDEDDVLDRFRLALDRHPADHVVRITADCPLTDPAVVRAALDEHLRAGADYTSNTLIRTYPDGLDVEVMAAGALRVACDEATDPVEREHVTPFLYRRNRRFALRALRTGERLGHLRWTVDDASDLDVVRELVGSGRSPGWRWVDLLADLPAERRAPLRDGLRPAIPGEVPGVVGDLADPGHHALVALVDGAVVGSLVADVDDGVVAVRGRVDPDHLEAVRTQFAAFVRSTPQITGGDVELSGLTPIGAAR